MAESAAAPEPEPEREQEDTDVSDRRLYRRLPLGGRVLRCAVSTCICTRGLELDLGRGSVETAEG